MEFLQNWQDEYLNAYVIPWAINIVMALVIFVFGRWLAKGLTKWIGRLMAKGKVDATLTTFLGNIIYAALMVVVAIAALDQLGVDTTSVMAIFAAAGLAIGLALKDSLANFSSGVMLVLFRPFNKGDFVEAAGVAGIVEQINIFNTVMRTGDNREVIVPNSQIYGGTIINYSARDTRRIDMVFGIGYDDDIRKAKALIEDVVKSDPRVLADPALTVAVSELADSSVNFVVRPWVKTEDYWAVLFDLTENLKIACDENGISIPYPQRDVYIHQADAA